MPQHLIGVAVAGVVVYALHIRLPGLFGRDLQDAFEVDGKHLRVIGALDGLPEQEFVLIPPFGGGGPFVLSGAGLERVSPAGRDKNEIVVVQSRVADFAVLRVLADARVPEKTMK